MKELFKCISSGISIFLLYSVSIFVAPIIMILFGVRQFSSSPKLFGFPLYEITMAESNFVSEATFLGALLSFFIGVLLYVGFYFLTRKSNLSTD